MNSYHDLLFWNSFVNVTVRIMLMCETTMLISADKTSGDGIDVLNVQQQITQTTTQNTTIVYM